MISDKQKMIELKERSCVLKYLSLPSIQIPGQVIYSRFAFLGLAGPTEAAIYEYVSPVNGDIAPAPVCFPKPQACLLAAQYQTKDCVVVARMLSFGGGAQKLHLTFEW